MSKDYVFIGKNLATFFIFLLLNGCVSAEKRPDPRAAQINAYLRLESITEAIRTGQVKQGMRYKELSSLIGKPDKVVQVTTDRHLDEQWVYEDRTSPEPKYFTFHFQDGALIEWH